jgi:CBS domain containing-hemolysin-like protein
MVPRPDMFVLPASMDVEAALGKVVESGRSRIPVTGDGLDDVVGILYAKDFLARAVVGGEAATVGDVMRPATYVPETKRVSELLREMQKDRVHMAIVIDEFGGTAGLVTIEDILEELVGEIVDEHDVEEPMVIPLEDGGYLIDARMHLDDFEELLEAEVADEDWDTVGGLVLGLAGRVPLEGESFEFDRYLLTAERVQGRRVARVRITAR